MEAFFDLMSEYKAAGVAIDVVYDIGANDGSWTRALRQVLPNATFCLFEANPVHTPALTAIARHVHIGPLSNSEREIDFYARDGTGDSYYKEQTTFYDGIAPRKVRAMTLPAAARDWPGPDLIKLDTQGSELDILRGGIDLLLAAKLVLIEMPILSYNEGAPCFQAYLDFLLTHGFVPVDLVDAYHDDNRLMHVDILFMNRSLHQQLFGAPRFFKTS